MQICKQCQYTNPNGATFCNRCGGHLHGSTNPMIDRIIDKYQLKDKIGGGGFGMVYRADHVKLGNPFAIKLLHPHLTTNPMMVERFEREARLLANLQHDNIVKVIDFGNVDGIGFYIVMEWLEGMTFQQHLKEEGPPPFDLLIDFFEQLLDALGYAHERGIVHRDLKPENLILLTTGRRRTLKILDFGIARMVQETERRLTETGLAVGTPRYMSPEQAAGEVERIDHRTDLYACGVLLVELLTGKQLFHGTTNEILLHHMDTPAPRLSELAPEQNFSSGFEFVVRKALAKEPEDRFESAKQFLDALLEASEMDATQLLPDAGRSLPGYPSQPHLSVQHSYQQGYSGQHPHSGQHSHAHSAPYPSAQHTGGIAPPASAPPDPFGPDPSAITRALSRPQVPSPAGSISMPGQPPPYEEANTGRVSGSNYSGEKRSGSRQVPAAKRSPRPGAPQGTSVWLWAVVGLSGGLALALLFFVLGSMGNQNRNANARQQPPQGRLPALPGDNIPPALPPQRPTLPQLPRDPVIPPTQPNPTPTPNPRRLAASFTLRLFSSPSRAKVYLDDRLLQDRTPLQLTFPRGKRIIIRLKKDGYYSRTFTWTAAKDDSQTLQLKRRKRRFRRRRRRRRIRRRRTRPRRPIVRRTKPSRLYTLRIRTIPAGARVLVDGAYKGKSPLTVRVRSGKNVKVLLQKEGFLTKSFYWSANKNDRRTIRLPENIF